MKVHDAIALSRLILKFGQVFRATEDAEGRPESDTTHSLMLALLAGELTAEESVPLDRGTVIALALVHDLAETFAGDTSTLRALSPEAQRDKDQREASALVRIREELAAFPWVLSLIERYEAQACLESRFVKYVDKVLPRLTHRDNGCAVPIRDGMSFEEFAARHRFHAAALAMHYPDFHATRDLFAAASRDSETQWGKMTEAVLHDWRTDGAHSNEHCARCGMVNDDPVRLDGEGFEPCTGCV